MRLTAIPYESYRAIALLCVFPYPAYYFWLNAWAPALHLCQVIRDQLSEKRVELSLSLCFSPSRRGRSSRCISRDYILQHSSFFERKSSRFVTNDNGRRLLRIRLFLRQNPLLWIRLIIKWWEIHAREHLHLELHSISLLLFLRIS